MRCFLCAAVMVGLCLVGVAGCGKEPPVQKGSGEEIKASRPMPKDPTKMEGSKKPK